jgi:uncharacterized membrane protein
MLGNGVRGDNAIEGVDDIEDDGDCAVGFTVEYIFELLVGCAFHNKSLVGSVSSGIVVVVGYLPLIVSNISCFFLSNSGFLYCITTVGLLNIFIKYIIKITIKIINNKSKNKNKYILYKN